MISKMLPVLGKGYGTFIRDFYSKTNAYIRIKKVNVVKSSYGAIIRVCHITVMVTAYKFPRLGKCTLIL